MIYQITGWTNGPHWHTALIEAESRQDAINILWNQLEDRDSWPMEIWEVYPIDEWEIKENSPLVFVLGGGCR